MNPLYPKYAGAAPNHVASRLMDVGREFAIADPVPEGFLGSRGIAGMPFARSFVGGSLEAGGDIADVVPKAVGAGARGGAKVLDAIVTPGTDGVGSPLWGLLNRQGRKGLTLGKAITGASILTLLAGADRAYQEGHTVAPLAEAQAAGENLMTDPFTSFVQKRASEKTAISASATRAAGKGIDVLDDVFRTLLTPKGGKTISMGRAGALAAGGLGLGVGADMFQGQDSVGSGVEHILAKKFIPIEDRIQATDTAASSFLQQSGKNMANLLDDALRESVNTGFGAAVHHNRSFNQDVQFQAAMNSDPLLRGATRQDKDLLRRSFNSMARFSPDLATDEFAVKNFLRESMMAANGPDYATLGNMARVNEAIAPLSVLPLKPKAPI